VESVLELYNVRKVYPRGPRRIEIFSDLSMEVRAKEMVAVIGSRHEGKTTLLRIAAGLEKVEGGRVLLCGREVGGEGEPIDRDGLIGGCVGWVDTGGTNSRRSGGTVLDRLSMPLLLGAGVAPQDARERAYEVLKWLGIEGCAQARPQDLSNWERLLVGVARAATTKPKLILLDDVLEGLGMIQIRELYGLLREVVDRTDCAMVLTGSSEECAGSADRVYVFDRGELTLVFPREGQGRVIRFPGQDAGEGPRRMQP